MGISKLFIWPHVVSLSPIWLEAVIVEMFKLSADKWRALLKHSLAVSKTLTAILSYICHLGVDNHISSAVWSELYKNKECKVELLSVTGDKMMAEVLRNYYPLSGHSFNNLSAPQPITTQQLNCYEINSHVKNVFESFEALQVVWSGGLQRPLQSSAEISRDRSVSIW